MPFVVCVTLTLYPDKDADFMPLMIQNARISRQVEPGCLQFDILTDPDAPETIFLYEMYTSPAAFQLHLDSEHFQRFDQAVSQMIAEKVVTTYRTLVS